MAHTPGLNRRRLLSAGWLAAVGAASGAGMAGAVSAAPLGPSARTIVANRFGTVADGAADDTKALQTALDAAFESGAVLTVPPGVYKISQTLRGRMLANGAHQIGISARGAHFISAITDGRNVFELTSAGDARFLVLEGLDILGTARDGHGISIRCDSPVAGSLRNFCLRDVVVQYCGGDGVHLIGDLSEGQLSNCYFRNNRGNGATLSNGSRSGGVSAVHVFGCVFGDNRRYGAALVDGCSDAAFHGCYFLQSGAFGLLAESGCTLLSNCGFENNYQDADRFEHGDAGIHLRGFGTLVACMGFSMLKQTQLIRADVTGGLVMVGCSGSGAAQAKAAGLARLAGKDTGAATLIGCSGTVECEGDFEPLEIAGEGGGIKFGSDWRSRNLPRFGDYRLWVDRRGSLRLKHGRPSRDEDGTVIGM